MSAVSSPYAWQPHVVAWAVIVVAVAGTVAGHRRLSRSVPHPIPWTRRQATAFGFAALAAAVALTWPVADLAAHWSLAALVVQRLVLTVAVPPLALVGLPYDVLQWLTRPAPVDAALDRLRRPLVALVVFAVIAIGSMDTALVSAQASSWAARGAIDVVVLAAGTVLWLPVIGRVPGLWRPRPAGRFAYLVAQAVLPAFLSFIYIFTRHPLYATFARSHRAIGLQPLADQQAAGFISKLTLLLVMLTVGAVVLARAQHIEEDADEDPLVWGDVERAFERVDRRGRRHDVPDDPPDPPRPPGSRLRP